jgi:hypothetical protein
MKDKVKASLVGGGDGQDRSQYSEAETSSTNGGTVSISHITQIAADEIKEYQKTTWETLIRRIVTVLSLHQACLHIVINPPGSVRGR